MRTRYWIILMHLLTWGGIFLLVSPWPLGIVNIELGPLSRRELAFFLFYGFVLNAVLTYSYAHWRLPVFLERRNPLFLLLTNVSYLVGFSLLESALDYLFIYNSYPEMVVEVLRGLLPSNLILTLFMLAGANFYGFAYAWFSDQQKRGDMEREKLRAELSALKHQINPHFLFNILNGLYGMAFENDDEPTAEGIAKLSNMMRYMLYEANDDEVSLNKELNFLENYIDLQKMRVNESVGISYKVQGNPAGHLIPPMILLPLVENAFKYGISQVRPSRIEIEVEIEPERIRFTVANTKHPVIQEQDKHKGIGLRNVRKRLNLLCKSRHNLQINDGDNYFTVELEIVVQDPLRRRLPLLFSGPLKDH